MRRSPSERAAKAWTALFFVGMFLLATLLFWLAFSLGGPLATLWARGTATKGTVGVMDWIASVLAWVVLLCFAVSALLVAVGGCVFALLPRRRARVAIVWPALALVSFVLFASALVVVGILCINILAGFASTGGRALGIVVLVFQLLVVLAFGAFVGWLALTSFRAFSPHFRADFRGAALPRFRELKRSLHLIRRSPLTLAGLLMVSAVVAVALLVQFAPSLIVPYPRDGGAVYYPQEFVKLPPSWTHPFGTDELGRDYLSRILLATPLDLFVAVLVVGSALVIGVLLGILSGFLGGWVDELIMRITDIFLSIPGLILAIAFAAAFGQRGVIYLMGALIIVWWPAYTRIIRGQTLSIRENLYIEAARAVGSKNWRIVLRHLLPNALAPVLVNSTLDLGGVILVAAALGYLGLGQPPPLPEWGRLVSDGQGYVLTGEWWLATFPGLAILLTSLSFNLVGDGLRDILDPRLRR